MRLKKITMFTHPNDPQVRAWFYNRKNAVQAQMALAMQISCDFEGRIRKKPRTMLAPPGNRQSK